MEVTDTGVRPEVERVEENAWLARMQEYPPGLDPRGNFQYHSDLVATAEPQNAPVPVEPDGSILGGEKERILGGVYMEQHMQPGPELFSEAEVLPPASDPYDMLTPLGTPEGWRPEPGTVVGATLATPVGGPVLDK